jgi:hypothetical protein
MLKQCIKQCIKCCTTKCISDFSFRKDTQKYRNECKICCQIRIKNIKNDIMNIGKKEDHKIINLP